ncbi:MAG TPA: caspase family protein [Thermoanaerobaculia bacterium]|nr:caspase family protein [Thermoanaerobaculia bacterium]
MADPIRVSFHVGVGTFDSTIYPTAKPLVSASDDAREMYNLADSLGYTALDLVPRGQWDGTGPKPPNVKTNAEANYAAVVGFFQDAAALLANQGDGCLITFSSHGTQLDNPDGGPDGQFDEAVCLFDFPMRDDVLSGLLGGFKKGVNVLLVLDCCHSGATSPNSGILLGVKAAFDDFWALLRPSRPQLGIAKAAPKPAAGPPQLAVDLQNQFNDSDSLTLNANVGVFQACRHDERTFDGKVAGELSVYTRKFVDAARGGAKSIGKLRDAIAIAKPTIPNCTPQFQRGGDNFLETPLQPAPPLIGPPQ